MTTPSMAEQHDQALRQSEERYRRLFENMVEGYAYCRMIFEDGIAVDWIYLAVNPAFEALTGLKDATGKQVSELIPGIRETDRELFDIYGRVSQTGRAERFETYVKALQVWFSVSVYSPEKEHFVAVFDVITERKRAEEALRQAEEKYRTIVDHAVEGIFQSTPAGRFLSANPALAHMWGYASPRELIECVTDISQQVYANPNQRADFCRLMDVHGQVQGFEFQALRKDGSVMWVSENARAVRDPAGALLYYEGTTQDITARKQAEQALQNRAEEFSALYETTRDLAQMLDLPTLLKTIVDRAVHLLHASDGGIYLYDKADGDLQVQVALEPSTPIGTRLRLGEGMAGRVAQSREPLIVDDYRTWPHRSPKFSGSPLSAILQVPMLFAGELVGVLEVAEVGETSRKFTDADARLLSLFASQAASAVYNAQLIAQARRRAEQLTLLNTIARTVGSTLDMDILLETCLRQLIAVMPADSYYIGIYHPQAQAIELVIHYDAGEHYPPATLPLGNGLSSLVIRGGRTLLIHRLSEETSSLPVQPVITGTGRASESWLGVPMSVGGETLGLLAFASYTPDAFDGDDAELVGNVASQVAIAVDNARHHAAVQDQAQRDSLTHAFNHGYLLKRLNEATEHARGYGSTLSLIMLDIEHFKKYNDKYGHAVGDQVLRLMVDAIQAHLKKWDSVGRWGGEEFAIVLPGATAAQARRVAERIRTTLSKLPLFSADGKPLRKPTVSQGIAQFPVHASTAVALVDAADRALYRAKEHGRDQTLVARGHIRR